MKRLKIVALTAAVLTFTFSGLSAARQTNPENIQAKQQNESAPDREDYVVSRLKSYFENKQQFRQLKSGNQQKPGREITMLLKEAAVSSGAWSDEGREYVQMFLKRPTETTSTWPWNSDIFYLPAPVLTFEPDAGTYPTIAGKIKFWYVTHTTPDSGQTVHTTTLDYVKQMAAAFETVYDVTINTMGYPAPPDDSAIAENGGDDRLDIYVMDCGAYSVYGYTVLEQIGGNSTSFMVMDNDYSEFLDYNDTEEEAMQVTAAHEFHHVVQFGINTDASDWIMEATSTWMEDQIYDDIDDNLQYLNSSEGFFLNPHRSIDSEFQWYNSWILLEYMETKWDQEAVKSIWTNYLTTIDSGTTAVINVMADEGTDQRAAFKDFSKMNYVQEGFYSNHLLYNPVHITNETSEIGFNLGYASANSDVFDSDLISLSHLSAKYFKLTPGASTGSGDQDKLTVYINGSDSRQIDVVPIITWADSSTTQPAFTLDAANDGTLTVEDFNRSTVSSIVFALVNYSTSEDNSTFTLTGGIGADGEANNAPGLITEEEPETNSSSGGCFVNSLR